MNRAFSQRIVELRREKGLKQKEAAKELGISQALLSHYEKGIRECGLDFIIKCSEYYEVSCDYLLGTSEYRSGGVLFSGEKKVYSSQDKILSAVINETLNISGKIKSEKARFDFFRMIYFFTYHQLALLAHLGCVEEDAFELPFIESNILSASAIATIEAKFIHSNYDDVKDKTISDVAKKFIASSEKKLKENITEIF
ncbi:MAG: helix-turn-helix transcriptional regulator [Clostridiales bacterium]|nr:helix-turn-helix transcriptional regulator [Clostridiales bacterium]